MSAGYFDALSGEASSFTCYLTGEFAEIFGPDDPLTAKEAARALSVAMEEYGFEEQIPSNLLSLMIARVLWTLNRKPEAEAYLKLHLGPRESVDMYTALLDRPDFDIRTWQMLDSKILTRQSWDSLHEQSVWVLNLESLCNDASLCYELALCMLLKGLVEQLAAYGDQRDGAFFVALRGFTPDTHDMSAGEVKQYCEMVLHQLREKQGWGHVPVVGFVDLPREA